jgi:hypothetical protein
LRKIVRNGFRRGRAFVLSTRPVILHFPMFTYGYGRHDERIGTDDVLAPKQPARGPGGAVRTRLAGPGEGVFYLPP